MEGTTSRPACYAEKEMAKKWRQGDRQARFLHVLHDVKSIWRSKFLSMYVPSVFQ
jgi:hypothetical protein